jgi:hypothetical protein
MDENYETNETSSVKKAANLANDAVVITVIAVSVVGLGKLAYDTAELGIESFKNWRKKKNEK